MDHGGKKVTTSELMDTHEGGKDAFCVGFLPKLLQKRRLPSSPSSDHNEMVVPLSLSILKMLLKRGNLPLSSKKHLGLLAGARGKRVRSDRGGCHAYLWLSIR